jgi:hypothetical protein
MTIYHVFKDADLIEGRGPMVFDSAWTTHELAKLRCEQAPNYMGTSKWNNNRYGALEIREVEVMDRPQVPRPSDAELLDELTLTLTAHPLNIDQKFRNTPFTWREVLDARKPSLLDRLRPKK